MGSSTTRTFEWQTNASRDEIRTVMRALEPQLVAAISAIPSMRHDDYHIGTSDGWHTVAADELEDVWPQLKDVDSVSVSYTNILDLKRAGSPYTSDLRLHAYRKKAIEVSLRISGPLTNEASGLIENVRNRIDLEIMRQEAAGWAAAPIDMPALDQPASGLPKQGSEAGDTLGLSKEEKSQVIKVRRGPILQEDLIGLLEIAAEGAKSLSIDVTWADGSQATATRLSQMKSVADAFNIARVWGRFSYTGGSTLHFDLDRRDDYTFTALGPIAQQRISALAQYWSRIPGRGRLSYYFLVPFTWVMLYLASITALVAVTAAFQGGSKVALYSTAGLLIETCVILLVWSTPSGRARYRLIVPSRSSRPNIWQLIGAISGMSSAVIAIIAYLFPRK
ncbi:hypothetical protein [Mycobacterium intracellulare]|uniref:hypothetical protein n=1 Tax=Mycobacterium intracellulare TaxID=1767 RepID=UPI0012FE1928|nr:hypothetical protein [Mycobacterium intracellulare]